MNCSVIVWLESVRAERSEPCYVLEALEEFTRKVACYQGLESGTDWLSVSSGHSQ